MFALLCGRRKSYFREIAQQVLIESVKCAVQWSDRFTAAGFGLQRYHQRLLFDRSHMSVDAAIGGVGIALESTGNGKILVDQAARRRLVSVLNRPSRTAAQLSRRNALLEATMDSLLLGHTCVSDFIHAAFRSRC